MPSFDDFATDHAVGQVHTSALQNAVGEAFNELKAELGAAPQGLADSVAARLDDIETTGIKTPYNYRGPAATNTTYNLWDLIVYDTRPVVCVTTFTTGATQPVFISGANFVPLAHITTIYAQAYGWRNDQDPASAAINTQALKDAILAAKVRGGGIVELPMKWGYVTKDGSNAWAIELLEHVWIKGQGMYGTRIALAAGANCTMVKSHTSTNGTSDGNAMVCGVLDMTLGGSKQDQGAGSWHGIDFTTNPQYTNASGDSAFDPHHLVQNVRVRDMKGDGIYCHGRSATIGRNVHAWNCDGHGFTQDFDTMWIGCQAEGNQKHGFNRPSQASGCKAFGNGISDPATYAGFYMDRVATLADCHAQNNDGHGYIVDHEGVTLQSCHSDSNNRAKSTSPYYPGVKLTANAKNCIVDVASKHEHQGVEIGDESYAIQFDPATTGNDVRITQTAIGAATVIAPVLASIPAGNHVRANGVDLTTVLDDVNGIVISSPVNGHTLTYQDGEWINLPSGSTAFFGGIFGDASDGDATLDGAATVTWASKNDSVYTMTRDCHCDELVVADGVTLKPNGWKVYARTSITFATGSVVNVDGGNGSADGTAGAAAGASAASTYSTITGGAGQTAVGSNGSTGTGAALCGVGNGGAGGLGPSGAGGSGTFATQSSGAALRTAQAGVTSMVPLNMGSGIKSLSGGPGGGGGGGNGAVKGGGGGGGGGAVVMLSPTIVNDGSISAKGGDGGSPASGDAGGGGGGGGGVIVAYTVTPWTAGTTNVSGGTKGIKQGSGVDGSNGSSGQVLNVVVG